MKWIALFVLFAFASPADAQVQAKVTHWGTIGTTWTLKQFNPTTKEIRNYIIENFSTTATDTLWFGHYYSNRIDTSVTYRTFLLPGNVFSPPPCNILGLYIKGKTSAIPYQIVFTDK